MKKTAEATGDLIGNKIADRIAKVSKTLPKKNSEEALRERFTPLQLRHQIIDDLGLQEESYWQYKISTVI